jgi:hypothetical protein
MWKEAVVAYFETLSNHFLGGTEVNHKDLSQDNRLPRRESKREPREYELLPTTVQQATCLKNDIKCYNTMLQS